MEVQEKMNLLKINVDTIKTELHKIQQDEQKQTTEDHQINQMHLVSTIFQTRYRVAGK